VARRLSVLVLTVSMIAAACGGTTATTSSDLGAATTAASDAAGCADVVDVVVTAQGGTYRFDVTVASVETGWDKYADRWEVVGADGTVYGTRVLAHPHVDEQPFTRSASGIRIPGDVSTVVVRAHDSVAGTCGDTLAVELPDR